MRRILILGVAGLTMLVPGPLSVPAGGQGPAYYTLDDLGTLGNARLTPRGINGAGHVTGLAEYYDSFGNLIGTGGFLITSGPAVAVPGFGYLPTEANGINDSGVVVGFGADSTFGVRAFRYSTATGATAIGVLGGFDPYFATSHGMAINAVGQVAGYSGDFTYHAFRHTLGGTLEDIGTLGGENSYGYGINDSGVVTGCAEDASWSLRAFTWSAPGTLTDLGTLGGAQSCGLAVNTSGQVVGWSDLATGRRQAFRYPTAPGQMQPLGTLAGHLDSRAIDVNDAGEVVGWSADAAGATRAILFTDASGLVDLNTRVDPALGWTLTQATGVNNAGQIVGVATVGGQTRAFRLTPPAAPPTPPPPPPPPPSPPPPPQDTTPPTIGAVAAGPNALWPPLGQMVPVQVSALVSDDVDPSPACRITAVSSSQPDRGPRGGDRRTDFVVTGDLTVRLRAELAPPRNVERIYAITVSCSDASGNTASGHTTVRVLRVPPWSSGRPGAPDGTGSQAVPPASPAGKRRG